MTNILESTINKFQLIFTKDEMSRISYEEKNGDNIIVIDVHGMKCAAAQRFVHNIIVVIKAAFKLLIIHGYHRGTAIRDMLRTQLNESRVLSIIPEDDNDGRTILVCRA